MNGFTKEIFSKMPSTLSKCVVLVIGLMGCHTKPVQTAEEARAGFVLAFDNNTPNGIER
jgi:hypothetical protein